jgi:hypothetical protein
MLQAHSFLWHYLWLAPHVLQVALAILIWRRGLQKSFPVFLAYLFFEAIEEFTLYGMDVLPSVGAEAWWNAFCVGLIVQGLLMFALIGELALHLLRPWPALANLGSRLISGAGVVLVLLAAVAAAYAPIDSTQTAISSRAHILEQTLYIVLSGLVLSVFLFAAHFKLTWDNFAFGIALGLGILSCEHLGAWAVTASGALIEKRHLLDFLNMATYHACVLIWFYYFLVPQKIAISFAVTPPEHNLDLWNRELERLIQQ